ncbi:hypothetical protein GCM10023116_33220 [Kistimonas scapharcae]|uniref:histidine kinase n=1 Tax=Kistimonas scapharcae TaxID=1036133 RepID=A0ABP8V4W5_9GAMM
MALRTSLGVKLSSVILVMMVSSSILFTLFVVLDSNRHARAELTANARALAQILTITVSDHLYREDYPRIEEHLRKIVELYDQIQKAEIRLPDERVIGYAREPLIHDEPLFEHQEPVLARSGEVMGHVRVALQNPGDSTWLQSHVPELVAVSLLQAVCVSLVLLICIRRLVVTPLRQLAGQAERIGEGELSESVRMERQDEIGLLSGIMEGMRCNLNDLYNKILMQYSELDRRVDERTAELQEKNRELEETRSQLIQSEKMATIGVLAAGVAHEINNPVGYISSNLKSLEEYVDAMDDIIRAYEAKEPALAETGSLQEMTALKARHDLDYIRDDLPDLLEACKEGVFRIGETVSELMAFSRQNQHRWQEADVQACLDSTLNLIRSEIHHLEKDFQPLPRIRCIPSQLNQVFLNLLINAIHASGDNGRIYLRTHRVGDWVEVSIRDTGEGIAPEIRDKVFEPFFTTKAVGAGTGLGLAVSYDIIQKHHGEMLVDPDYTDGCGFIIRLPVNGSGGV